MLLEINHLFFSHQPESPIFKDLNLTVNQGEILALAGESGCGKSTLLSLIYGLLQWESGTIIFDGIPLLGPAGNLVPGEMKMKFVAQNYDLMPYATVAENVGKFLSNVNRKAKQEKVEELLEVVGMSAFAKRFPKNLSGGQQQRVAIARALSVTPKLLLLDEPFSNLDFSRKIELREKLFHYVKKENVSLIISTHDIPEVMPWLDQIVVLQEGEMIQKDTPENTYHQPYNEYVARLFGEVNVFTEDEKEQFQLVKSFWFPNEIKISNDGFPAEVLESRFSGGFYWNKIKLQQKEMVIYTEAKIFGAVHIRFVG